MEINTQTFISMQILTIQERINALREDMRRTGLDVYLVLHSDPHFNEYLPARWESIAWLTGFTGSAANMLITETKAFLWTDSRYWLQAEKQLHNTGVQLMKEGDSQTVSFLPYVQSLHQNNSLRIGINREQLSLKMSDSLPFLIQTDDLIDIIWDNRPKSPTSPITIVPNNVAGLSPSEKIAQVYSLIKGAGCDTLYINKLDELCWLLNLRAQDIPFNPVFHGQAVLHCGQLFLIIDETRITTDIQKHLQTHNIEIITDFWAWFTRLRQPGGTACCKNADSIRPCADHRYVADTWGPVPPIDFNPIERLKAIKNSAEIDGLREAMLYDGVALVRFERWLEHRISEKTPTTELDVMNELYKLRGAHQSNRGESFETIAGYGTNGAIVHYTATPDAHRSLSPESFLLVDSGGQYTMGTTDITRTYPLGALTTEECRDYTAVLRGHIHLSMAQFPEGTLGHQLDPLARFPIWEIGGQYGHGTGHGVGHYLNVHETPPSIRMNPTPGCIVPGMVTSDEPGLYRANKHGIRIENLILCVHKETTDFGEFYGFEPLTLCPISTKPIMKDMMTDKEIKYLNTYHKLVFEKLSPFLEAEEVTWLKEKTTAI